MSSFSSSASPGAAFDLCLVLSEGWPTLWPAHRMLSDAAARQEISVSTCSWNAHIAEARGKEQALSRTLVHTATVPTEASGKIKQTITAAKANSFSVTVTAPLEASSRIQTPASPISGVVQNARLLVLLLRQPCDYILYADAFQQWLRNPTVETIATFNPQAGKNSPPSDGARSLATTSPNVKLMNEAELCIWNMRKHIYLMDLAAEGVQITPTVVIAPGSATTETLDSLRMAVSAKVEQLPVYGRSDIEDGESDVVVVKPSMSVGSIGAVKLPRDAVASYVHKQWQNNKDTAFLAQSYLADAHLSGEFSAVFFNNRFSHCLTRRLSSNRQCGAATPSTVTDFNSDSDTDIANVNVSDGGSNNQAEADADADADSECRLSSTADDCDAAVSAIPFNGDMIVVDPAPPRFVAWATQVMAALAAVSKRRKLGNPPVYARVDGIRNAQAFSSSSAPLSSAYFLLELELIEPSLGLDLAAGACDRFIAAIQERIQLDRDEHIQMQQLVNLANSPRLAGGMRKLSRAAAVSQSRKLSATAAAAVSASRKLSVSFPIPRVHRSSVDSLGRLLLTIGRKVDYLQDPQLRASYDRLPLDPYVKGNFRSRRYGRVRIGEHRHSGEFQWTVESQNTFTQSSMLNRAFGDVERVFDPIEDCIINSEALKKFVIRLIWPHFRVLGVKMEMGIHQIRITYSRRQDESDDKHNVDAEAEARADESQMIKEAIEAMPTPEGLHRDGFHFVAMGCVRRDPRLEGGLTEIFPYPLPKVKRLSQVNGDNETVTDGGSASATIKLATESDSDSDTDESDSQFNGPAVYGPQVAIPGVHSPLLQFTLLDGDFALIDDVGLQHQVSPIYVPDTPKHKHKHKQIHALANTNGDAQSATTQSLSATPSAPSIPSHNEAACVTAGGSVSSNCSAGRPRNVVEIHRDMLILTFMQLDMPLFTENSSSVRSQSLESHNDY